MKNPFANEIHCSPFTIGVHNILPLRTRGSVWHVCPRETHSGFSAMTALAIYRLYVSAKRNGGGLIGRVEGGDLWAFRADRSTVNGELQMFLRFSPEFACGEYWSVTQIPQISQIFGWGGTLAQAR